MPGRWVRDALCAQTDPALFFPPKGSSNGAVAKRICAACPVLDVCLAYALAHPKLEGIWGATTDRERQTMRARRVT